MSQPLRIALFGGSFDPVHLGHVQIARAARKALDLNLVIFIPCRQSPHKDRGATADESERLEMLELATADLPWAEVSDLETCLPPPSYSWITAETMHEIFPADPPLNRYYTVGLPLSLQDLCTITSKKTHPRYGCSETSLRKGLMKFL